MKQIIGALAIMISLPGCGARDDNDAQASPRASESPTEPARPAAVTRIAPSQPVPPWDATRCGDDEYRNARMERHPNLTDRTANDLLSAYGTPHADTRFRAGEGVGTYSGGVASQLPGGAARNARTPVREIVWQQGACTFVVRFRQADDAWRVFDAFEASVDADF